VADVTYFKIHGIRLEKVKKPKKISVIIAGNTTEVRTLLRPYTNLQRYNHAPLLGLT